MLISTLADKKDHLKDGSLEIERDILLYEQQTKYQVRQPSFDVLRHKVEIKSSEPVDSELTFDYSKHTNIGQEPWRRDELVHLNMLESSYVKRLIKERGSRCYFCGFYDLHFLEIHNLDGNHSNTHESNLVPSCKLCHRQHHLLWLSTYRHAEIGAIPANRIDQTQLNMMMRISHVLNHHPDIDISKKWGAEGFALSFLFNERMARPKPFDMLPLDLQNQMKYQHVTDQLSAEARTFIDELREGRSFHDLPDNIKPEVNEALVNAEKKARERHKDPNNRFNIFEMAMALKDAPDRFIHLFKPSSIRLIYKPSIFTEEEIDHYLKRECFNPNLWHRFSYDNM